MFDLGFIYSHQRFLETDIDLSRKPWWKNSQCVWECPSDSETILAGVWVVQHNCKQFWAVFMKVTSLLLKVFCDIISVFLIYWIKARFIQLRYYTSRLTAICSSFRQAIVQLCKFHEQRRYWGILITSKKMPFKYELRDLLSKFSVHEFYVFLKPKYPRTYITP